MDDLTTLKRINILIRSKKIMMHRDNLELANLIQKLKETKESLNESQKKYMEGVQKINEIRKSSMRNGLDLFEKNVDSVKNEWISYYRKKQILEGKLDAMRLSIAKSKKFLNDLEERQLNLTKSLQANLQKKEDENSYDIYVSSQNKRIYGAS